MTRLLRVLAVSLALVFAQESGAKEYSFRVCQGIMPPNFEDCEKCKEIGVAKIKISKNAKAVAIVLPNESPIVFKECRFFDEDTFSCEETINDSFSVEVISASLADGFFTLSHRTYIGKTSSGYSYCALEKKGLLNFFK
ncbi:MAG: hypothetical protein RLZ92_1526 [Pseudomonadota bacterium]